MNHQWKKVLTKSPYDSAHTIKWGFPSGSDSKESACDAGDLGSIPGQEDPLEKGMVTHSSILAWRIPWTEESGRLQSMGLQRVGNDWAHKQTSNNCVRGTVNRKGGEGNGEPGRLQSMGSLRVGHD